jgi:hypothetical protein
MYLGFPTGISGSELALAVVKNGREMLRFEASARKPRHPIGPCQSKLYTASLRLRAGQSSTVFADESPTRSAGFGTENGLYLFALTMPWRANEIVMRHLTRQPDAR